jgi:hypothetical protein
MKSKYYFFQSFIVFAICSFVQLFFNLKYKLKNKIKIFIVRVNDFGLWKMTNMLTRSMQKQMNEVL